MAVVNILRGPRPSENLGPNRSRLANAVADNARRKVYSVYDEVYNQQGTRYALTPIERELYAAFFFLPDLSDGRVRAVHEGKEDFKYALAGNRIQINPNEVDFWRQANGVLVSEPWWPADWVLATADGNNRLHFLVVECDGKRHEEKEQQKVDRRRDREIATLGPQWAIQRFSGSEINHDSLKCVKTILDWAENRWYS